MQPTPKRNSQAYDYVIVGSGLSGLLIANSLAKMTSNILLIESSDFMGGQNKAQDSQYGKINNGLRFLPDTELSRKAIEFIESLIDSKVEAESADNALLTFDHAHLKPFVGFGDDSPVFYDELSYFMSQKELQTDSQVHEWIQKLSEKFLERCPQKNWMSRSYVTKFHEENGVVASATINGQKTVFGQNFIYCGHPKDLAQLLPENALAYRAKHKLEKSKLWTAVCLDLFHTQKVAENNSMHVLNGTTHDELGPSVGRFIEHEETQYSQWISFIDNEDSEDEELIAHALKKIKRQVKRAHPAALDNLKFERILVAPSMGGSPELKLNSNQSLPTLPNLWIGSGLVNTQRNLLGALLQAEMVASALGCHPKGEGLTHLRESAVETANDEASL